MTTTPDIAPADLLDPAPTPESVLARLGEREQCALLALSLTHFRPLPVRLRSRGEVLIALGLAFRSGQDFGISDLGLAVRRLIEERRGDA